mmetsp:Transcript_5797/g.11715  ORF Transcript_5797/g.11715 Transcript_5797/m.11715 type:complete len:217 (-) Transcript_5797:74-724(-)
MTADDPCAICLQKRSALTSTTHCGHTFCRRCLDEWRDASNNGDCPACRCQLPEAYCFAEACLLAEEGKDTDAEEKFREALGLCAQAPWAAPHYNLGLLLSRKKDLHGAEKEFRRAAELRSDDADAALNWGRALLCVGRHGEALAALSRAKRLRPGCGSVREAIAKAEAAARGPRGPVRHGVGALTPRQLATLKVARRLPPLPSGVGIEGSVRPPKP